MGNIDAAREEFAEVEVYGRLALFTDFRIDKSTIPEGVYCYAMRHGDDDAEPVTIEEHVVVNYYGAILTTLPMDFGGKDYIPISFDNFWFTGEHMKLEQFQEKMKRFRMNEIFEYQGFHYVPLRRFDPEEEQMSLREMSKFLVSPGETSAGTMAYRYDEFYKASGDSEADIFLCAENGKQYIPCENELQEYRPSKMMEQEKRR